MLSNLVEAISQLLSNTTLLTSLSLEGLPLKIPYLNPICEVHIFLSIIYLYVHWQWIGAMCAETDCCVKCADVIHPREIFTYFWYADYIGVKASGLIK